MNPLGLTKGLLVKIFDEEYIVSLDEMVKKRRIRKHFYKETEILGFF